MPAPMIATRMGFFSLIDMLVRTEMAEVKRAQAPEKIPGVVQRSR